jgi:hypothetical protein
MMRCDGCAASQNCIKALAGAGRLHGRQLLFPRDVEICSSSRIGSVARVVRLGLRTSRSRTCCAWRRLVVRGGDLSCEGSSSGKLVGDAVNWLKTGRHTTTQAELQVNGGLLLDVVVSKGTTVLELLASKQLTPPRGLRSCRC